MRDLINRQAAIEAVGYYSLHSGDKLLFADKPLRELPPAQPEITLESAIDYLHGIGWMQEHDRIMAESAPVVHAHWNETFDYTGTCYAECSRCGLLWWIEEGTAEENEMFYCPKCGAKMDGGGVSE